MSKREITSGNERTITAEDQFTDEIFVADGREGAVIMTGTGTLTTTLQCRLVGKTDWIDVSTVTDVISTYDGIGAFWRVGCKAGGYTSGNKFVRIQGNSSSVI